MLEKEFKYYLDHQAELLKKYNGRVIVIKGDKVIGDYNSEAEAYTESLKSNELGTFLIQVCTPGSDSYTQTFHSRVVFS
jgi:hypothetical protein